MRRLLMLAAALALNGCIAERMAALRGRPIGDVERRFGAPAKVAAITQDLRIYTWTRRADLKAAPPPVSTFQPVANGQFRRVRHLYDLGIYCEFRVLAQQRPAGSAWLVKRVYNPGVACG